MSTPLAVSCPNCGAGLKLKSKTFVGKKVPCPKCKKPFLVEEPPEDEFMADDDFGGGDDYQEEEEEEEQPRSKKAAKAAKGGKGKKKSKGGGSGIVLMIGGAVLGVGVLVGVVYGAMALFSGMGGSSGWTAWMPEDTDMVIRVRPSEIANSPFLKPVMDHPTLSKLANTPAPAGQGDGANALVTALNLSVRDIDSITMGGKSFAMGGSTSKEFVVVVRTKAAVDSAKLDQATTVITKETYNGKTVYNFNNSNPKMLLYPATPETLVFGTDANVRAAIDRKGAGPGSRFVLSDANAQIFVCAAPKDTSAFKQGSTPGSPFNSSLRFGSGTKEAQLKSITFGINFNSDATITMEMNSLDTFDSKVQTDIMKSDIEKVKMELNAAGGGFLDPTAGLKAQVKTMLDGATVNVSGKTATVKMTLPGKIVSDGLALAAPFMPMLEQMVAQQQKAASATAAAPSAAGMMAPSLNGPGGITAYPGAVINAGNSAQNRIDNLGDQHNAALAAQMQEGGAGGHGAPPAGNSGGAVDPAAAMRLQQQATPPAAGGASSSHGDSSGGGLGGDPAEIMRRQQQAAPLAPGGGASSSHGDSSGGAPGGAAAANPAEAMRRQIAPGAANNSSGDSSGGAAGAANPEEAMRRQIAPGAANNSSGDSSGGAAAGNPEEAMRRQQQAPLAPGGGASSSHGAGGGAPGAAAPAGNPEEAMRQRQQGNPIAPGGAGGGADPAEMMRRQQGGAAGQPAAQGGQNGNGNDPNKPAPRSRSRRRTN